MIKPNRMSDFMSYHPSLNTSQRSPTSTDPFNFIPGPSEVRNTDDIGIQAIHTIQINIRLCAIVRFIKSQTRDFIKPPEHLGNIS